MINVGVIGYGYWGPNIVRNFNEAAETRVVSVSDLSAERLALAKRRYPSIETTLDHRDLFKDPRIDAIAIATPVSTHLPIALGALRGGKHVWVEKPLTPTAQESELLIEEATKRNLNLHVDHTFVYTPAVRKIKSLIDEGELGPIYYYDSVRVNLGLFQRDVSVIWDLAVHDLSIMENILPSRPHTVSATGISHIPGQPENIAYLTLFYPDDLIAHIHVNWLAPVKLRSTLIGGSKKMIVYDDLEPSEKIKLYNKGITLHDSAEDRYQMRVGYRAGDMMAPHLEVGEALLTEVRHFAHCINSGTASQTDGHAGLSVVKILEAATRSMMSKGRPVELDNMKVIS